MMRVVCRRAHTILHLGCSERAAGSAERLAIHRPAWKLQGQGQHLQPSKLVHSNAIAADITELIGSTPLVALRRVPGPDCKASRVLAKLEFANPGGSVKDRIAKAMIEQSEKRGEITPGRTTIVEATSGNTGIGLAMVCAAKGYKCTIIMPQVPSMKERYLICRKFGAHVHLTAFAPGATAFENMMDHMAGLLAQPDHWSPQQFSNRDNPQCHIHTTGPEIWQQTGGDIDYFVAGAGTGGTMAGVGTYLKEQNSQLTNVLVEPTESRVLTGALPDQHSIVGIGAGVPLPFIEALSPEQPWSDAPRGDVDEFASATSEEAVAWADRLAAEEGMLVGPSAGAACKVACQVAARDEAAGKTVVVVFASSAVRYMTHPLWAPLAAEAGLILAPPPDLSNEPPLLRWKSEEYTPPHPSEE